MQWVALILWLVLSWDIGLAGAGDVAASDIGVVTQFKGGCEGVAGARSL